MEEKKRQVKAAARKAPAKSTKDSLKKSSSLIEKDEETSITADITAEIGEDVAEGIAKTDPKTSKESNTATAKKASDLLLKNGFRIPDATQRQILLVAFAKTGAVIYGRAFDAFKIDGNFNLTDVEKDPKKLKNVTLYEMKSTNRANVKEDFSGYFFSMSTAELLVAQSLGKQFKFVMVNVQTEKIQEMTLRELLQKAKGIHPSWSVRF